MINRKAFASLVTLVILYTSLSASDRGSSTIHKSRYYAISTSSKQNSEYAWQLETTGSPLIKITGPAVSYADLKGQLAFPINKLQARVFEPVTYDSSTREILIPTIDEANNQRSVRIGNGPNSTTPEIKLIDSPNSKTLLTIDGAKYTFVLLPDNEFRCVSIRHYHGISIDFLYTARDIQLRAIVDSFGRQITFNYVDQQLRSLTQTWSSEGKQLSNTWQSDIPGIQQLDVLKYAHSPTKLLPANALVISYTAEMRESDRSLASIFGGPSSVAAANGFEPEALNNAYPYYRGDITGDDGRTHQGHLSATMHLYGSPDGTADSPIYIPLGFTSHSIQPTPVDAAVTFYYPQLGALKNTTIAVFHVRNFGLSQEANRVRIGEIGGPGGSSPEYKHAHFEFYQGDTGLPSPDRRPALRILPNSIF